MEILQQKINATGIRFSVQVQDDEVGRARLYILQNELRPRPFGFIEDVFVDESCRGQGIGTKLIQEMIAAAKAADCYKIVMTSRHAKPKVHDLYEKLGFKDWGKEFRMELG